MDFIWTERFVTDLLDGAHLEDLGDGVLRSVPARFPSYYEQRAKAEDMGDPEMALDAIQLDMAMDRMTDMVAKAAMQLRLQGWDYSNIGAVLRDKRRRTGAEMVESGVKAVIRHERRRADR